MLASTANPDSFDHLLNDLSRYLSIPPQSWDREGCCVLQLDQYPLVVRRDADNWRLVLVVGLGPAGASLSERVLKIALRHNFGATVRPTACFGIDPEEDRLFLFDSHALHGAGEDFTGFLNRFFAAFHDCTGWSGGDAALASAPAPAVPAFADALPFGLRF